MAINFPNSPIEGTTYPYQGITYTYKVVEGAGYWQANSPGNYGPAIGADVIAGTNAFKFVTPEALEDSDYWSARNDGPGSGLDADTIDGVDSSQFLRSDIDYTANSGVRTTFQTQNGVSASATNNIKTLKIEQRGTTGDAFLTFHISADYATYFGLDKSTDDLFVGGWSSGATKHKIYSAKNCPRSLATNGYQKLASGLIIQWGRKTNIADNATYDITLPIAFPSAHLTCLASANKVINGGSNLASVFAENLSLTKLRIMTEFSYNPTTTDAHWIAIGF